MHLSSQKCCIGDRHKFFLYGWRNVDIKTVQGNRRHVSSLGNPMDVYYYQWNMHLSSVCLYCIEVTDKMRSMFEFLLASTGFRINKSCYLLSLQSVSHQYRIGCSFFRKSFYDSKNSPLSCLNVATLINEIPLL